MNKKILVVFFVIVISIAFWFLTMIPNEGKKSTKENGSTKGVIENPNDSKIDHDKGGEVEREDPIKVMPEEEDKKPSSINIAVTGVDLNQNAVALTVGDVFLVKASVKPANATNRAVTWTSSNAKVATVTNGQIKAIAAGMATITVKTADGGESATIIVTVKAKTQAKPPTSHQAVKAMKIGWNLGNTLDSINGVNWVPGDAAAIARYETLWGNPVTTKAMIDEIKKAGFNAVRIPVSYRNHMDSSGKIDSKWLDRVEEIVSYVLANDMYCLLDVHHDTGMHANSWIFSNNSGNIGQSKKDLAYLWQQIATRFKNYDYKLIFEGFNEIVNKYPNPGWDWVSNYWDIRRVNEFNQVFVDTVRATGSKNANRVLAVSTYGASTDEQKLREIFAIPNGETTDTIILSLHDYATTTSGIDSLMKRINTYIISKNIAIVLSEFGTTASQNYGGSQITLQQRIDSASYYVTEAKKIGITCFWWDDGGSYLLFRRSNLTWHQPGIKDAITKPFK